MFYNHIYSFCAPRDHVSSLMNLCCLQWPDQTMHLLCVLATQVQFLALRKKVHLLEHLLCNYYFHKHHLSSGLPHFTGYKVGKQVQRGQVNLFGIMQPTRESFLFKHKQGGSEKHRILEQKRKLFPLCLTYFSLCISRSLFCVCVWF